MKHQVADRLFFGLFSLAVAGIAMGSGDSISAYLVRSGGVPAELGVMIFCTLAVLALIDTVVNDVLPARFSFQTGYRWRQTVWLGIAISFAAHTFVIINSGFGYGSAVMYFLCAVRCAAVSFLDLQHEFADAMQNRRSTDPGGFDV